MTYNQQLSNIRWRQSNETQELKASSQKQPHALVAKDTKMKADTKIKQIDIIQTPNKK